MLETTYNLVGNQSQLAGYLESIVKELIRGSFAWILTNLCNLFEHSHSNSPTFRLELYKVFCNLFKVIDKREWSKENVCNQYQLIKLLCQQLGKSFVQDSFEFAKLLEVLDVIFLKHYDPKDLFISPMSKNCLNMGLIKQFLEQGGFELIEKAITKTQKEK